VELQGLLSSFPREQEIHSFSAAGSIFSDIQGFGQSFGFVFEVGSEVRGRATFLLIVYILQSLKGTASMALLF